MHVDRLKTETIQQSSSYPQIIIGNHIIQQVSRKKVLGVIIDEQLKWKEHNDAQCKKKFPVNCSLEKSKAIYKSRYTSKHVQCTCPTSFHILFECMK